MKRCLPLALGRRQNGGDVRPLGAGPLGSEVDDVRRAWGSRGPPWSLSISSLKTTRRAAGGGVRLPRRDRPGCLVSWRCSGVSPCTLEAWGLPGLLRGANSRRGLRYVPEGESLPGGGPRGTWSPCVSNAAEGHATSAPPRRTLRRHAIQAAVEDGPGATGSAGHPSPRQGTPGLWIRIPARSGCGQPQIPRGTLRAIGQLMSTLRSRRRWPDRPQGRTRP